MSLPDQTPKLPKLPFIIGDVVLLGAAIYIAFREAGPLSAPAMAAITACVVLAAIVGAVPFLTDYAHKQDEALDERQRSLDALSRTINTAAEQISIAANGLNELTDLTHKNLKQAEQLPHKLQDKIAEFNAQLDNARENDREELEKELAELRSLETDRLQTVTDKVQKAIGELTKFEATQQQQFKHQLEQLERAHTDSARSHKNTAQALQDRHAELVRDLAAAHEKALAELDHAFSKKAAALLGTGEPEARRASLNPEPATAPASTSDDESVAPDSTSKVVPVGEVAAPPKRQRKTRRDDAVPSEPPSATGESSAATATPFQPETFFDPAIPAEPAPIPAETIAQIAPVVPASQEPFPIPHAIEPPTADAASTAHPAAASDSLPSSRPDAPQDGKKAAPRKTVPEPAADAFELSSDEPVDAEEMPMSSAEAAERVISSDGATRLIATSYIGIGNRLFIRGEGPGLSWEKGVPLQFVSIGKWRWETPEATAPIRFKLYKNDEVECPGLGALDLEAGHQQEVIAKF